MGKVTFAGGKVGMKVPVAYPANFADATWEQIIEACQTKKVPDTWEIGDQKIMVIGDLDYVIDIIGKNHDTYSDGSGKAPLTFQMHNLHWGAAMNASDTNVGGWTSSSVRTSTLPGILSFMSSDIQSSIKEVTKLTSEGGKSSVIKATADKLFLLSEIEVLGSVVKSFGGEGTQYAYYAAGNSKVKVSGNSAKEWWLRSPSRIVDTSFVCVTSSGTTEYSAASVWQYGLAFAFCF